MILYTFTVARVKISYQHWERTDFVITGQASPIFLRLLNAIMCRYRLTAAIIVRSVLSISSWSFLHNWMIKGILCLVCSKQPMAPWRYTKAGFDQWMSPRREEPRTAASGITFFKVSSIVKWQLVGSWCVAAGVWILSRVYKVCLSCDV